MAKMLTDTLTKQVEALQQEVTERAHAEEELRRIRTELEQRVQERTAELTRTNAALQQQTALLQSILECMSEDVVVVDTQGKIVVINQAAQHTLGIGPVDAPEQGWSRFVQIYSSDRQTFFPPEQLPLVRAMRGETVDDCEQFIRNGDNPAGLWRSVNGRPLLDAEGRVCGGVAVGHNITERKRLEEALRASEERFRLLSDFAPIGIFLNDAQGACLYTNPRWREITGMTLEESLGEGWTGAIHFEDQEKIMAAWEACLREEKEFSIEFRFVQPSGEVRWVHSRVAALRSDTGELRGHVGTTEDITERKHMETALRASETIYRSLIEQAADGIYITDSQGNFLMVNAQTCVISGYTEEELLRMNIRDFLLEEDLRQAPLRLEEILAGHAVIQMERRIRCKDGTLRYLESRARALDGGRIQILVHDVTDRKQAEEEARQYYAQVEESRQRAEQQAANLVELAEELAIARDQAEAATRAKSEFLATMSHEIRTPMNGIIGMTGLLLDTELTGEQREYADTVRNSADALLTIINDILDFSKIEAGKLELEVIDFDLRHAVEESLELLAERAYAKGLELIHLVHANVPTAVRGDPGRLRQILLNLLSNALKFTEHGEVMIEVKTVAPGATSQDKNTQQTEGIPRSSSPCRLEFSVRDTGIGIPADRLDRLFRSFSQVDTSTTRKYGGTGLGLAICKKLVELMGGSIEVQSTPGVGSTFRFTVCLEQQSQEAPSTPFPLADLHGLRALVIDDNATNRAVLFHYLSAWGMECTCVENGEHGLRALREAHLQAHPYHMAILDFHMPDMDGLEVARAIRADTRLASLPLVLFSSVGLRGEAAQARQAGINAYLTKPVRHSQLYQTLAAMPGRALQKNTPPAPSFVPRHSLTETTAQRRPLLLLVEDNIVNQKLAVRLLEKMGYRADVAANGLEALEAFSRISYAAILMDCLMPEMDGFEATTAIRLREQATGAHVSIIAMTANAMQEDKERCLAVGMDDYIAKPIKPDTLKAIVARWTTMELQDVSPAPSLDETLLG